MTILPEITRDFPRLADLMSATPADRITSSYFAEFLVTVTTFVDARAHYLELEKRLRVLDDEAWSVLRAKCLPYVMSRDGQRGWAQLYSTLNEAYGYELLLDLGYLCPRFVTEGSTPQPDLFASEGSRCALVEVKTIQESDQSLREMWANSMRFRAREPLAFTEVPELLSDGLGRKIKHCLAVARQQLHAVPAPASAQRIAVLVVRLDHEVGDMLGHEEQLAGICRDTAPDGVDVLLVRPHTRYSVVPSWRRRERQ